MIFESFSQRGLGENSACIQKIEEMVKEHGGIYDSTKLQQKEVKDQNGNLGTVYSYNDESIPWPAAPMGDPTSGG
jgi:hypothetical protein